MDDGPEKEPGDPFPDFSFTHCVFEPQETGFTGHVPIEIKARYCLDRDVWDVDVGYWSWPIMESFTSDAALDQGIWLALQLIEWVGRSCVRHGWRLCNAHIDNKHVRDGVSAFRLNVEVESPADREFGETGCGSDFLRFVNLVKSGGQVPSFKPPALERLKAARYGSRTTAGSHAMTDPVRMRIPEGPLEDAPTGLIEMPRGHQPSRARAAGHAETPKIEDGYDCGYEHCPRTGERG